MAKRILVTFFKRENMKILRPLTLPGAISNFSIIFLMDLTFYLASFLTQYRTINETFKKITKVGDIAYMALENGQRKWTYAIIEITSQTVSEV